MCLSVLIRIFWKESCFQEWMCYKGVKFCRGEYSKWGHLCSVEIFLNQQNGSSSYLYLIKYSAASSTLNQCLKIRYKLALNHLTLGSSMIIIMLKTTDIITVISRLAIMWGSWLFWQVWEWLHDDDDPRGWGQERSRHRQQWGQRRRVLTEEETTQDETRREQGLLCWPLQTVWWLT